VHIQNFLRAHRCMKFTRYKISPSNSLTSCTIL